jgi:hypothetical protein
MGIYGYGLHHDAPLNVPVSLSSARRLHKTIRENFGTIVFCRRYLERLGVEKYLAGVGLLFLFSVQTWPLSQTVLTTCADELPRRERNRRGVPAADGHQGVVLGPV